MRAVALAAAGLILLQACSDDPEKRLQDARSWRATAIAVGKARMSGAVPAAYANDALKKASKELAKGPLSGAGSTVEDLRGALERDDRSAAERRLDELERQ